MRIRTTLLFLLISFAAVFPQKRISWKRSAPEKEPDLQLFHSTHAVNLPTAETLQKGDWEFEISHRFVPRINDGNKAFYGFDGPVNMRIALGYAISHSSVLTLGRSNVADNYDLIFKHKIAQFRDDTFPISSSVNLGAAWNT